VPYAYTQKLLGIAQISAFPSLYELFLSFKEFLLIYAQKENFINIDDDDDTLVLINKDARVYVQAYKA